MMGDGERSRDDFTEYEANHPVRRSSSLFLTLFFALVLSFLMKLC